MANHALSAFHALFALFQVAHQLRIINRHAAAAACLVVLVLPRLFMGHVDVDGPMVFLLPACWRFDRHLALPPHGRSCPLLRARRHGPFALLDDARQDLLVGHRQSTVWVLPLVWQANRHELLWINHRFRHERGVSMAVQ